MAAALARCGGTSTEQQGGGGAVKEGGTLNAGWWLQEFENLDPALIELGVEMEAAINIFDGLTRISPTLDIEGVLAESWEVSEDGTTYTFKLREGVKWHNGDDFTSDDVLFTYDRTNDPKFASAHISKLDPIKSIDAPDEFTVVFQLKEPFAPFLAICTNFPGRALTPVNETAFKELGRGGYTLEPVGTGPFKVVEHNQGQQLVLERNEDYWQPNVPMLDEIVIQNIPEGSTVNSALQAGDIDFVNHPPEQFVSQFEGNPNFEVPKKVGTNWIGFQMHYKNPDAPFFADPKVRMAFAKAIDRETFVEKGYFGLAVPAYGVLNPAVKWAFDEDKARTQAYDVEAAKKLLSDADATGISVELLQPVEEQRRAEILADMLSDIGVDVTLDIQEETVYIERRDTGDHQFIHSGSVTDPDPDESVYNFFHSEGGFNRYGYSDPTTDKLLEEQRREMDQEKRAQILWDAEAHLTQQVAAAWTVHEMDAATYNATKVGGFEHVPELRPFHKLGLVS